MTTPWIGSAFRRGLSWLVFLGPFFFLSYGYANRHASQIDAIKGVASFHFAWERGIPLWPWTIIPYWSIDLLYDFAFLCCRDRAATNRLGLRLLGPQLTCIACFLLCPMRFAFERPPVEGLAGALFSALTRFDLPYNQAPSLHIALLVIIWRQFATLAATRAVRVLIHGWALVIGVSVLTTWQHHFIDVPTGLAVGLLCLWLWPEEGIPPLKKARSRQPALALYYVAGAALSLTAALALGGGSGLLAGWLALALAMVAFNYAWAGAAGFQKQRGRHSLAARWLFAPYTLAAWINARLWTRRYREPGPVTNELWLGPLPTARAFSAWAARHDGEAALFDLTAELPAPVLPAQSIYDGMPCLDLVPIQATSRTDGDLADPVLRLSALHGAGRPVWIACALGYSRSASVAAAWLCTAAGAAASVRDAVSLVRRARPKVTLGKASLEYLETFHAAWLRR
jgi:protein-tyrosine phosphatase